MGIRSIIIEQTSIACAASGKAGGFLARDWGSGTTADQLHKKSYELHKKLADELGITSYRKIDTLEVDGNRKGSNVASWLNGKASSSLMDRNTAQVLTVKHFFVCEMFYQCQSRFFLFLLVGDTIGAG